VQSQTHRLLSDYVFAIEYISIVTQVEGSDRLLGISQTKFLGKRSRSDILSFLFDLPQHITVAPLDQAPADKS
jgi:hypothetical protein